MEGAEGAQGPGHSVPVKVQARNGLKQKYQKKKKGNVNGVVQLCTTPPLKGSRLKKVRGEAKKGKEKKSPRCCLRCCRVCG